MSYKTRPQMNIKLSTIYSISPIPQPCPIFAILMIFFSKDRILHRHCQWQLSSMHQAFQQVKCVFIVLWLFRLRHLNFIEMFKVGRETLPDLLQGLFSVQNFLPFLLRNWRNIILEIKKYDSRIEEIWFSLKELQFSWSHIGGAISNFILLIVIDAERENIKLIKLKYFILFGIFCIAAR